MRKILLATFLLVFACSPAYATDYEYWFSNAGGGSTCSEGSPCALLSDAKTKIDALAAEHDVTLYFNKGDTWTIDTDVPGSRIYPLIVSATNPTVHIDAYGSGDRPIFDGNVADFPNASVSGAGGTGPYNYDAFFLIQRGGCSIDNVEIKQVYGNAIELKNLDTFGWDLGFTSDNCLIHHFGNGAYKGNSSTGVTGVTIENTEVHTGQQLWRYQKSAGWGAAINLLVSAHYCGQNKVQHCTVYDIAGEGINCTNGLIEYCIVGDTFSIGLNCAPHKWNADESIIRYNLCYSPDLSSSDYAWCSTSSNPGGSSPDGVRAYDEGVGGTNANAHIKIYGNIFINRSNAFKAYVVDEEDGPPYHGGDAFGRVDFYNNLIIDCGVTSGGDVRPAMRIADLSGDDPTTTARVAKILNIQNNAIIFYNMTPSTARFATDNIADTDAAWTDCTIDYNLFWQPGGGATIDSRWDGNEVLLDPKIPGEALGTPIDWTGLVSAAIPTSGGVALDFDLHFYPPSDSKLINEGTIPSGGEASLLGYTTNWDTSTTLKGITSPVLIETDAYGSGWEIGAVAYGMTIIVLFPADGATGIDPDSTIRWTNPAGTSANGVDIYWENDPLLVSGSPVIVSPNAAASTESYTPGTIPNSTLYYWGVSINDLEYEVYSYTTTGTPAETPPAGYVSGAGSVVFKSSSMKVKRP